MADEVIVVTGGAHGIGAAIAQPCAAEGAAVALVDVNGPGLDRTAGSIEIGEPRPVTFVGDVADTAVAERLTEATATSGRVTGLVNNAAVLFEADTAATTDQWDKTIAVNLTAAWLMARPFILAWSKPDAVPS